MNLYLIKSKYKLQLRKLINIAFVLNLIGCSSVKKIAVGVDILDILKKSEVFSNHHTGFSLYDIEEGKFIANHNSHLLFTPASNTKLLTMYATLSSFQDSIPALLYHKTDSNLLVQAIGEPTFLLEGFSHQPVYSFLSNQTAIEIILSEPLSPYGAGWMWDDYPYSFQPERSWWPIYGNRVKIHQKDSIISVSPSFFNAFVDINKEGDKKSIYRDYHFNSFSLNSKYDTTDFEHNIPFIYSEDLLVQLLSDTLKIERIQLSKHKLSSPDTLFSQHVDTVLTKMLKPSDNFLAEQLLILCAWKNGFSSVKEYITFFGSTKLSFLGDIIWADGSGLSRYNLLSPNDQIRLLNKSHEEFGWERLKTILPTGGEGTLQDLYLSEYPFIYGKTGTLSNVHNLSGFLLTKSGKKLIFSLMNNHYARPKEDVEKAMEDLLVKIRNAY